MEQQKMEQQKIRILNTVRGDNFLPLYKPFIQKFGIIGSAYLSLIMDQYTYHKKHNSLKNDMFYLTHKKASCLLNESEYSIKKRKDQLKKGQYIYTKRMGAPAKEYIGINFDKIDNIINEMIYYEQNKIQDPMNSGGLDPMNSGGLDPMNSGGLDPMNSGGHIYKTKTNKTKTNNIVRNLENNNFNSLEDSSNKTNNTKNDPKNKIYLNLSKKLADIISSNKNINCNSQIKSWVSPIRLLITKDLNGMKFIDAKKRVDDVLDFYSNNIGGEYIPVIESGNTLRKKFIKLEDAMIRQNKKPKQGYTKQSIRNGTRMSDEVKQRLKDRTITIE